MSFKRLVSLAVLHFCLTATLFANTYGGGAGTPGEPYKIRDAGDLLVLAAL